MKRAALQREQRRVLDANAALRLFVGLRVVDEIMRIHRQLALLRMNQGDHIEPDTLYRRVQSKLECCQT